MILEDFVDALVTPPLFVGRSVIFFFTKTTEEA
jgi:hypothetical protein